PAMRKTAPLTPVVLPASNVVATSQPQATTRRWAGGATLAAGGVLAAVSTVGLIRTGRVLSEVNRQQRDDQSLSVTRAEYEDARRWATASWVGLGIGISSAVVGGIFLGTRDADTMPRLTVWAAPGGGALSVSAGF
ncbi:MAG: hypothetical protein ACT4TC_24260, partial [Myxococcaceae bacterium]